MTQLAKAIAQAKRLKREITPKLARPRVAKKRASERTTRQAVLKSQILLPVIVQMDIESILAVNTERPSGPGVRTS
jgi:hypothetical protein